MIDTLQDHVIIAGFGVGGRFVAEYLSAQAIAFVVVDLNGQTFITQRRLGVPIVQGDISDPDVLRRAGVDRARILALTIPDEQAALLATEAANALNSNIHIIAGTRYTSTGLVALKKGADEVIVAEQAVAQEFYRRIANIISREEARAS
jgi:CPA2 family monovalent cation:H+ antiporter-2